jgi:Endosomal/lysosomal potassium channel TMEM175
MIRGMESGARSHVSPRRARFERKQSELEFARIVTFSDGVFAIAMTLLVLALHVPEGLSDLNDALKDQLPDFLAFGLSFAVLAQVWFFHHRFFGSLGRFDATLIALNFLYLGAGCARPVHQRADRRLRRSFDRGGDLRLQHGGAGPGRGRDGPLCVRT